MATHIALGNAKELNELVRIPQSEELDDLDLLPATEGRAQLRRHLVLERNRGIVEHKKRSVWAEKGNLHAKSADSILRRHTAPEVKGFARRTIWRHYRECANLPKLLSPISIWQSFAPIAICHRMVHRGEPITITELTGMVEKTSKNRAAAMRTCRKPYPE